MKETLASIDAPDKPKQKGFNAGIVLWDDVVVETAPILRYMRKWTRERVRNYCAGKGWTVEVVHELERRRPYGRERYEPDRRDHLEDRPATDPGRR